MSVYFLPRRWSEEVLCESHIAPSDFFNSDPKARNAENIERFRQKWMQHVAATCQPDNEPPKAA